MSEQIYSPIIFIGRQPELALFEQMLEHAKEQEWILNIYGEGGIGKTQLLQRYVALAIEHQRHDNNLLVTTKPIDLYLTAHQVELGILKSLADQLYPEQFQSFYTAFNQYYNSPDALTILREKFLEVYKNLTTVRHIVLFFDTIEIASEAAKRFFNEMLPRLKDAHPGTFVIAAGRTPLQTEPHHSIKVLKLTGLSPEEIGQYFESQQIEMSPEIINRLATLSGGRPILIALMVDWLNFGNTPEELVDQLPQQFEQAMVERVSQLRFPEDQTILAMAHFYRRFGEQILARIFDKTLEEAKALTKSLEHFSFVKYRSSPDGGVNSCLLHDEMRHLVNKYVWRSFDPMYTFRQEWSRKIVSYYVEQLEFEKNPIEQQHLERERLYYWLDANLEEGITYWRQLVGQAKTPEVKEAINAELQHFEKRLSPDMKHELQLGQADVLYAQGRYPQAAILMETMLNAKDCPPILQAESRAKLILSYTNSGDVPKAIEFGENSKTYFERVLNELSVNDSQRSTIQLQFGYLHNNLGYAYRKQNQIDYAVTHYEKALEFYKNLKGAGVDKDKATTKNNLGYVLHLLGRDEEAIAHCKGALRIKQRLGDPYELGLTYNVLGIIEADALREQQAMVYFKQALKSFEEANNQRGQALVYIAWGRMLRQLGWRTKLEQPYDEWSIQENYQKAGEMFDQAIAILRNTDKSSLVEALNEKGALLREQGGNWSEAIKYFSESKELAEKVQNYSAVADNLQHLGATYFFSGQIELAWTFSQQAIDIATKHEYTHILGWAQLNMVRIMFTLDNYQTAFEWITDCINNILKSDLHGQVNTPIKKGLRSLDLAKELVSMIEKLPTDALKEEHAEYLIQRWQQEGLTNDYNGFIIAIRDVAGI
jgi:tetratricopeptide (TPR) repeat protein